MSPTATSIFTSSVPGPTATTSASCGFSFALPDRISPPYVFSIASSFLITTLLPSGLIPTLITYLHRSVDLLISYAINIILQFLLLRNADFEKNSFTVLHLSNPLRYGLSHFVSTQYSRVLTHNPYSTHGLPFCQQTHEKNKRQKGEDTFTFPPFKAIIPD